jgi:hypothetical protein
VRGTGELSMAVGDDRQQIAAWHGDLWARALAAKSGSSSSRHRVAAQKVVCDLVGWREALQGVNAIIRMGGFWLGFGFSSMRSDQATNQLEAIPDLERSQGCLALSTSSTENRPSPNAPVIRYLGRESSVQGVRPCNDSFDCI